jgi:hypothetical protein
MLEVEARQAPDKLNDKQLADFKYCLLDTCKSVPTALEELGLEGFNEDTVEDQLLDGSPSVERCGDCEWWHESGALTWVEEHNAAFCDGCLEDK